MIDPCALASVIIILTCLYLTLSSDYLKMETYGMELIQRMLFYTSRESTPGLGVGSLSTILQKCIGELPHFMVGKVRASACLISDSFYCLYQF